MVAWPREVLPAAFSFSKRTPEPPAPPTRNAPFVTVGKTTYPAAVFKKPSTPGSAFLKTATVSCASATGTSARTVDENPRKRTSMVATPAARTRFEVPDMGNLWPLAGSRRWCRPMFRPAAEHVERGRFARRAWLWRRAATTKFDLPAAALGAWLATAFTRRMMRPTNMAPQNLDVPCSTFFPLSPLDPTGRLLDSRGHRGGGIRSVPGGFKNV